MSVAGGLPLAADRAALHGCQALQIFTKNASQWRGRPLPPEEVAAFRARATAAGLAPIVSHGSYLINLASGNAALRAQSIAAMADEIDRAESLRLFGVVLHPGSSADRAGGLALIGDALAELFDAGRDGRTMVLLEHTAGQGNTLGWQFAEIASIIRRANGHARLGVCLDTCHLLAAGYDIASAEGYADTFDASEPKSDLHA
jgi:deoxyribonuclease IV